MKLNRTIIQDLIAEKERADYSSYFDKSQHMAILSEQVGDVAHALLDGEGKDWLREELIELAVISILWLEELDADN